MRRCSLEETELKKERRYEMNDNRAKRNRVKRPIIGAFLALLLLFAAGTAVPAQVRTRVFVQPRVFVGPRFFGFHPYPYTYYTYDPIAYQQERGYSDGLSRGKSDARHGKAEDPQAHNHYLDSNSLAYRNAFLQGYRDGFEGQRG
jgi:hypothetical protein